MSLPDRADFFVSTQWLADHLGLADLKVVDGSFFMPDEGRKPDVEFAKGHIPGAVLFDIDAIADHHTDLPHMLPNSQAFADAMENLGIGNHTRLVIYDASGLFVGSARVWWSLRLFGAKWVRILEGGLSKWKAEGRPLQEGPQQLACARAKFTATFDQGAVADADFVKKASECGSAQILDARTKPRFKGEVPEPRAGLRSGHIPGSLNLPWREVVGASEIKPAAELSAIFAATGLDLNRPIITTCGSGVSAAILLLALETLGKDKIVLYDGSWSEWGGRSDLPVAIG
jgi:thiosulfate/3-mercaptopyruvate sulfurtransferase